MHTTHSRETSSDTHTEACSRNVARHKQHQETKQETTHWEKWERERQMEGGGGEGEKLGGKWDATQKE